MAKYEVGDRVKIVRPHRDLGYYSIPLRLWYTPHVIAGLGGPRGAEQRYRFLDESGNGWSVMESMLDLDTPLTPFQKRVEAYLVQTRG